MWRHLPVTSRYRAKKSFWTRGRQGTTQYRENIHLSGVVIKIKLRRKGSSETVQVRRWAQCLLHESPSGGMSDAGLLRCPDNCCSNADSTRPNLTCPKSPTLAPLLGAAHRTSRSSRSSTLTPASKF